MSHQVYLALGTNLGDRAANLRCAIDALAPDVQVLDVSQVYETAPWGIVDQPPFLNQVAAGETALSPRALLIFLKELEIKLGRRPAARYGPRLIDLDILFYDDLVFEAPGLEIPHPRLSERAFVLVPLADLAPDLRHPQLGRTIHELLQQVDCSGVVVYSPAPPPHGP